MTERQHPRAGAFTFAEVLIAAGVASLALLALAIGAIAVQRGFTAAEYQVECQEDQLRVMDYVTRDVHRALDVKVENQNRKLTVTLPGFKVRPGAAGLSLPNVKDGTVKYAEAPLTVIYVKNGNEFTRYENGVGTVLSTRIEEFFAYDDDRPRVRVVVNFVPHFSLRKNAAAKAATEVSTTVCLRNPGRLLK